MSSLGGDFFPLDRCMCNLSFNRPSPDLTVLSLQVLYQCSFAQFRKFDLKFETEIIIRSKYWNSVSVGYFSFFLLFVQTQLSH